MLETIGHFIDPLEPTDEYLTLGFSPSPRAREERWRNYGLSADFLGDYFATFFPGTAKDGDRIAQNDTVRSSVSYVANELIENAIKYSDRTMAIPVVISLYLYNSNIVLLASNCAPKALAHHFQDYSKTLVTSDLDVLYTQQLERVATNQEGPSCLGLITMAVDYQAKLGWQFTSHATHENIVIVRVMAQIDL